MKKEEEVAQRKSEGKRKRGETSGEKNFYFLFLCE